MVNLIWPSRLASALLMLVYFYRMYSNTLDIFLHWFISRCPVWTVSRDPILGVLSISFVWSSCSWFTVRIPQGFCCCPLDWRICIGIFLSLCYLFSSGNLQNSWEDCLATEGMSQEVLSLTFFFRLVTKKFSCDVFLALTTGLIRWSSFLVLWKEISM